MLLVVDHHFAERLRSVAAANGDEPVEVDTVRQRIAVGIQTVPRLRVHVVAHVSGESPENPDALARHRYHGG